MRFDRGFYVSGGALCILIYHDRQLNPFGHQPMRIGGYARHKYANRGKSADSDNCAAQF